MRLKEVGLAKIFGVACALVGLAVWAEANPLVMSASVGGGPTSGSQLLTISSTQPMPKGWFNKGNRLDRDGKIELRVTYTIGATACSPEQVTQTLSSYVDGDFEPVLNSNGTNVDGWKWTASVDVSAYANHYTLRVHCDGSKEVIGCDQPRPVSVTVQAFDHAGAPLTYTDDSGATQYVAVTLDAGSIAAVLDGTVQDACQSNNCGIGQCVSACIATCRAEGGKPQPCHIDCMCTCKILKSIENPPCHENLGQCSAP